MGTIVIFRHMTFLSSEFFQVLVMSRNIIYGVPSAERALS